MPLGVAVDPMFQCYKCSYNKLETDNVAVDFVLGMLAKLSDEHCKLENADDIFEVQVRNCPPPESGQVNKCVNIQGEVTTSISKGPFGMYIITGGKCHY